ncbi:SPOR domain-containing protein [Orbus sturtevantii]|uniref:SPOR domain-containing protein n=1 Tax=Orbus sturtevantii TaxID=3074109 RepID=UPI00370D5A4A
MNESIRPEKEDRYIADSSVKKTLSPKLNDIFLSKKKWIILVLALCVILLLLSFAIFKPTPEKQSSSTVTDLVTSHDSQPAEYHTLTPPAISRSATETETKLDDTTAKERIEVPGEVTDILANKIAELNEKNQIADSILLKGKNSNINKKANERPLQKTLANNHYTIQINSSSSLDGIMAFVKQYQLTNYQIYETRRSQKPWYVLIKGDYTSIEDAKNAIKLLPQGLQKNTPWVKSGEVVNKEKSSK